MPNERLPEREVAARKAKMDERQEEIRERLRAWVRHFVAQYGQRGLAEALGVSEVTISTALSKTTGPGLKCLLAMHYNLGMDLRQLVRDDPVETDVSLKAK